MLAGYESRLSARKENVWIGEYHNLHNLPHWHFESEYIHIRKGRASVSVNDRVCRAVEGQSLFCSGGDIHSIRGEAGSVICVILSDAAPVRGILGQHRLADTLLKHDYGIGGVFDAVRAEITAGEPYYEIRIESFLTDLTAKVFRGEETLPVRAAPSDGRAVRCKSLLEEIDRNYAYITFGDAAGFMGFSHSYFSKFFHRLSGMTFSRYLNTVRIGKAAEMLRDAGRPQTVTGIAAQCGYDTIRHFNRVFREITGTNPRKLPVDFGIGTDRMISVRNRFNPTLGVSETIYES